MKRALNDFSKIAAYYGEVAPHAERRIVTAIFTGVSSLADFPWKGHASGVWDSRELVVVDTDYLVTYRVRGELVEIVRIRHGARKPLSS